MCIQGLGHFSPLQKSFISLVQFIPKDFIFLGAIVPGINSLISSVNSLLGYTEVHDFWMRVLHSSTLLNYLSSLMVFWWSV
jgi:hypothetical protein